MATGYTHPVADGKVTTLKDFALSCARGMGALITMRDEPNDAEIPDSFEPDPHYLESMAEAKKELDNAIAMDDEAKLKAWREHKADVADRTEEVLREGDTKRERYLAMIKRVDGWKPPTDDHKGLKNFMLEQLHESMKFDCRAEARVKEDIIGIYKVFDTAEDWYLDHLHKCIERFKNRQEHYDEEVDRCRSRTEWIQALKASL